MLAHLKKVVWWAVWMWFCNRHVPSFQYEISTPRSSLTSTDLDSVEWGMPSGGFFRQREDNLVFLILRSNFQTANVLPREHWKKEEFSGLKIGLQCQYSDHHKSRKASRAVNYFLPSYPDWPESRPPGDSYYFENNVPPLPVLGHHIRWLTKLTFHPLYLSGNQVKRSLSIGHQPVQLHLRKFHAETYNFYVLLLSLLKLMNQIVVMLDLFYVHRRFS